MSSTPFRQRLALQVLTKGNRLKTTGAQGFTLIELLVVIVILGVLGAVGYQAYISQIGRANASTAANTATALAKNCSSLRITGDSTLFDAAISGIADTSQVTITAACAATGGPDTMTVRVGTGNSVRTAVATAQADGRVTPAPVPTA